MRKLILLLPFALSLPAFGQGVLTIDTQQCVWHPGDDPAWSSPNLDESGWRPYSEWKPASGQPLFWVRCHVDISTLKQLEHPAIQVKLHSSYQIYFNGSLIGNSGNLSNGNFTLDGVRAYPISASLLSTPTASISLRRRYRDLTSVPFATLSMLLTRLELFAGDEPILDALRAQTIMRRESQYLAIAICYGIIGIFGVILLGLFSFERSRLELLYLGVACISMVVVREMMFCNARLLDYPFSLCLKVEVLYQVFFLPAQLLFFFSLTRRRVPLTFWILLAATILFLSPEALDALMVNLQSTWLDSQHRMLLRTLTLASSLGICLAPFFAFWPFARIIRRMRPLAGLCIVFGVANVVYYAALLTEQRLPGIPNLYANWILPINASRGFVVSGVLGAILLLLVREQRQIALDRAVLAGEMQAASEIQRMLAPSKFETAPGLHVEVAFHPMREVGGDFYLCRALPDGRQRILLGDVSGKGAAAAMAAAVLIGAAQRHDGDSPATLLAHLNHVLVDMRLGGFATCLCTDIAADGAVTIANAGHLPPYCGGEELKTDSALPLGVAADATYIESSFALSPVDMLTFLSDGVVEAQSPAGELFGFERTRSISGQTAEEIAATAKRFGQQDDITVLTLGFAAAEMTSVRDLDAASRGQSFISPTS
jgi:hypothetical protein